MSLSVLENQDLIGGYATKIIRMDALSASIKAVKDLESFLVYYTSTSKMNYMGGAKTTDDLLVWEILDQDDHWISKC